MPSVLQQQLNRIELRGLDGSNLLAYMAALGALRCLSAARWPERILMSWSDDFGWWMPILHTCATRDEALACLTRQVCGDEQPGKEAFAIANDLTIPQSEFAGIAAAAANTATARERSTADFVAAFGSEACIADEKRGLIQDTAFRTMSGAGHQHFIGFMRELASVTEPGHLEATMFSDWEYEDDKPSMRWDPNDYRPHALRADDPASDPIKTMRGANRLAIEALPLFPTMPTSRGLRTTAFRSAQVTWPIWAERLDVNTVAGLLALRDLQEPDLNRPELTARGIVQVYRAQRFTDGKYRNFSPARAQL